MNSDNLIVELFFRIYKVELVNLNSQDNHRPLDD